MAFNDLDGNTEYPVYLPDQPSEYENIPSWIPQDDGYFEGEEEQNEVNDHIIGALRECLEEIDIKGKELFKKIVSNNRDLKITLGRFVREAIGDSRGKDFLGKIAMKVGKKISIDRKDGDFVVTERGASIDQEELNHKLERFKVKTVNIGGGVGKEEQK
ncbi:hypothetical protein L6452_29175 [Arctium lappa]|uniref:Uncharacterized protein n=1 Tax=Arctium lappa TaxID=4217 RepID=A0ACB8ZGS2_ARCLA|nr:hypothetical protein L6452_29175 [Arctium lappa]